MFKINGVFLLLLGYAMAHPQVPNLSSSFKHPNERSGGIGTRIVGGQEAKEKQFPYEAAIYVTKSSKTDFCGGSLISPSFVLTAAHCLTDPNAISAEVILGALRISEEEPSQIYITSTDFTIHPEWDSNSLINDLALINLGQNVSLSDYIQTIQLATDPSKTYVGNTGIVAGWGKTYDDQQGVTATLMYISNNILSNDDCKNIDPFESVIQPSHLCLDGAANKSICSGDSGGPLAVDGVQVGTVSFGYRYCQEGKPQVFSRLTAFHEWIRSNSDIGY